MDGALTPPPSAGLGCFGGSRQPQTAPRAAQPLRLPGQPLAARASAARARPHPIGRRSGTSSPALRDVSGSGTQLSGPAERPPSQEIVIADADSALTVR